MTLTIKFEDVMNRYKYYVKLPSLSSPYRYRFCNVDDLFPIRFTCHLKGVNCGRTKSINIFCIYSNYCTQTSSLERLATVSLNTVFCYVLIN